MTQAAAIHMTLGWHAVLNVTWEERTRRWQGVIDRRPLTVTNTMDPLESWVALGKERSEVLQHEQRHFDLNEVYRRRLFNALAGLRAEGTTRAAAEQALRDALQQTSSRLSLRRPRPRPATTKRRATERTHSSRPSGARRSPRGLPPFRSRPRRGSRRPGQD